MKIMNLLLAAIFTFTLCLSIMPGDVFAKSEMSSVDKTTNTAKTSIKKAGSSLPQDININTADKEQLTQLPGIGPKTADSILEYRNTNGKFKSIDDLTGVKGIGDKTLTKLKPYLKKV